MHSRLFMDGLIMLGAGLLASSVSAFLDHFTLFGAATDFASGFLDGLAVVAFGVAILVLARNRRVVKEMSHTPDDRSP